MADSLTAAGITSLDCMRCANAVAADSSLLVAVLVDLFSISVGALIGGVVTYAVYVKRREGETKERTKRLAQSVMYEVQRVQELLNSETRTAIRTNPYDAIGRFPTGVYDGLLNSASISNFDIGLQDQLHSFYEHFRGKPTDQILVPADTLAAEAVKIWDALNEHVKKQQAKSKLAWLGKKQSVREQ